MKAYTYSEARENFASVLEEAERDGQSRFAGATARSSGSRQREDPKPRRWM